MKTILDIYEGILSDIDTAIKDNDFAVKSLEIIEKLNSYLAKKIPAHKIKDLVDIDFSGEIPVVNIKCSVYYNHDLNLDGLTDGTFKFGKIGHHFCISDTDNIKSLKYGPTHVSADYDICGADKLVSLDGCPDYVGGDFFVHLTGIQKIDKLPKRIDGNLTISKNYKFTDTVLPKCDIGGYVSTFGNNMAFDKDDLKYCKVKFKRGNLLEGILDDIDTAIENSDNAVKERDRADKLSKMNIPTLRDLSPSTRNGLMFCWEMPTHILNMIKPYISDCVNTMEKNAGSWFKKYIIREACRIKVRCTGKILEFKLVRKDSGDGVVFFRLQGKDYYTFGRTNKDTFNLMVRMVEQMALHPDILVEMIKEPSTRSKITQKHYDKLMSAE